MVSSVVDSSSSSRTGRSGSSTITTGSSSRTGNGGRSGTTGSSRCSYRE